MPRTSRVKSKTGVYHVMLRGVNRQEIFHDEEDNLKFIYTLKRYKQQSAIEIFAWCLMNNHVHILLREGNEDLSVTMKRIAVSFAQYYNWKYRTSGHVFQGRFRSEVVEKKQYLLTVVRYIHQNPLKAHIVKGIADWHWSSCRDYYGEQTDFSELLNKEFILQFFSPDEQLAVLKFKKFNEETNDDQCLDMPPVKKRLTDEEARKLIKSVMNDLEIANVKSLPRHERNKLLSEIKGIDNLSLRQAARILGISYAIIQRAN